MLLSHMPDHGLAVKQILSDLLWRSLRNLHRVEMQCFQPFVELLTAAMRRIAADKTLHCFEPKDADNEALQRCHTMWQILGKSHLTSLCA